MNVYTPARYDERVFRLALGIEPRDAISQQRLISTVDVRPEEFPEPVSVWRTWRAGETLTSFLPRLHRHRSGRFVRHYDAGAPTSVDLRVVDDQRHGGFRISGQGRSIVPRRIRVDIATQQAVEDGEAADMPVPIWQRTFPIACFPGAAADLASRSTILRGRVVRIDGGTGDLVPVRWPRVQARNAALEEVGWAHGDEHGEFLLVVEQAEGAITVPADPLSVTVTVGATLPPLAPSVTDPVRAEVDPLWDLPIEIVTASETPLIEASINGRSFLPEHTQFAPITPVGAIDLPHGRDTSAVIRIA